MRKVRTKVERFLTGWVVHAESYGQFIRLRFVYRTRDEARRAAKIFHW